ncbi:MAG: cupin domain-containing protein [Arenicella sp.]
MKSLYRTPESKEYFFIEGCFILELYNSSEDPGLSIARARVRPGIETRLHQLHGVIERYIIQSGQGSVTIANNEPFNVIANDVVVIPANQPQKIRNTGDTDLIFLAICTPRFTAEAYKDSGSE